MSTPPPDTAEHSHVATGWRRMVRQGENLVLVFSLAAMVVLPVAEILLRSIGRSGIPASTAMVQHLVLAVGMLGGAVAARDNRLLSLAAGTQWLRGRWLVASRLFANGVGAAISVSLGWASWNFVQSQRQLGKIFAYGIPVWMVQLLLVVGFVLIALRLVLHVSATRWHRAVTLLIALVCVAIVYSASGDLEHWRWPAMAVLLLSLFMGAPIFTALGGTALILLWCSGEPLAPVPLKHYQLTVNPTLPSIPLFTLAGYFLAESGAARRLVRLFQALFGSMRGGPVIVTTLVCAFFTSFTGASGATILALGGVLMPVLAAAKFPERSSLGLLTGAGSLGMLFPPCLPPILYAIIASSSGEVSIGIGEMFLGGLLPGLLLVGLTAWWGLWEGRRHSLPSSAQPFRRREALAAVWEAKWELLVPVVALAALFGGYATPVEAAALTAFYTFVVAVVIHRDLRLFREVPRVMTECGLLVGGVMLILGVALGFTHYLIDAQIPDQAVGWATEAIHSRWVFLLLLNVVLLVVGGLVEIYAAIVVVVPLLVPIGIAFGINPVHLGIIFLANMELGFLAPPVGLNLLLASYRFNKPMTEVTRASLPMLAVMFIGVLLITYLPWLTTWLPGLFN